MPRILLAVMRVKIDFRWLVLTPATSLEIISSSLRSKRPPVCIQQARAPSRSRVNEASQLACINSTYIARGVVAAALLVSSSQAPKYLPSEPSVRGPSESEDISNGNASEARKYGVGRRIPVSSSGYREESWLSLRGMSITQSKHARLMIFIP